MKIADGDVITFRLMNLQITSFFKLHAKFKLLLCFQDHIHKEPDRCFLKQIGGKGKAKLKLSSSKVKYIFTSPS